MPIAIFMALLLLVLGGCAFVMLHNAENFGLNTFGLDRRRRR